MKKILTEKNKEIIDLKAENTNKFANIKNLDLEIGKAAIEIKMLKIQNEKSLELLTFKDKTISDLNVRNFDSVKKINSLELDIEDRKKALKIKMEEANEIITTKDQKISELEVENICSIEKMSNLELQITKIQKNLDFFTKEEECKSGVFSSKEKLPISKNDVSCEIKDLETREPITDGEGSFGTLYLATDQCNPPKKYAIKTISTLKKNEEEIKKEIGIWEKIQKNNKLRSIPRFYASNREETQTKTRTNIDYHLIFDYFPHTLKKIIRNLQKQKNDTFPLKKIIRFSKSLIHTLAYLQTMGVCHRDLKPENFLLEETIENIFIIDFGESKEIQNHAATFFATLAGTPKYLSPELYRILGAESEKSLKKINLYKSDVFAFGLVLLELGILKLPKRNKDEKIYAEAIENFISKFEIKYKEKAVQEDLEEELENFVELMRLCLRVNRKKRPDFIELFLKMIKISDRDNDEKIQKIILISDQDL